MDKAHEWTDDQLNKLERDMRREYDQALKEIREKQQSHMASYAKELEQREKALDGSEQMAQAHEKWLSDQSVRSNWLIDMSNSMAHCTTSSPTADMSKHMILL